MEIFKKVDLFNAVIIGEIAAWVMFFMGKNLATENAIVADSFSYFKFLPVIFPILCALGLVLAYYLGKIMPVIFQIAKFVLVGGLNFLIDLGVLNFLVFATGVVAGPVQSVFKATSFLAAVVNSYFWNKLWVFKRNTKEKTSQEFFQFFIVSVIGFAINIGVNYFFVNLVSAFWGIPPKTWTQLSAMFAAIAALFWNFVGYKFIVFDAK